MRHVSTYNVVLSGGGIVGAASMASLQLLRSRFLAEVKFDNTTPMPSAHAGRLSRLLLVDASSKPQYDARDAMQNLRAVSLTPVSSRVLDNLDCWRRLRTKHPFYRIALRHEQLSCPFFPEERRSASIFMQSLLGNSSAATAEPLLEFSDLDRPLGFVCYNAEVSAELFNVIFDNQKLLDSQSFSDDVAFRSTVASTTLPPHGVIDGELGEALVRRGDSGEELIGFSLLLGCEGRGSLLRSALATASVQHDYAQTAYVCTACLEKMDDGNVCCFQNFFQDGDIIAMLPTSDNTANIIFSTTDVRAREFMTATQSELVTELNKRLCAFAPRDIPRILEVPEETVNGKTTRAQGTFPLRLNLALRPYSARCLLLGDAAHGVHPFAGQGLNLGLYDVCALVEILERAIRTGQDIGSVSVVGQPFASEMMVHTGTMITAMEGIHALLGGVPALSCLGMKAIQKLPLLSSVGKKYITYVSSGGLFASRHSDCFLLS